jgi:hypothetical protein
MTTPTITGTVAVGQVLTGSAVGYADADGDAAGTHTYKWYRADNAAGTLNKAVIAGATSTTYTIVAADQNKFLVFEVTPTSSTGTPNTGDPVSRVTATAIPGTAPSVSNVDITGTYAVGQTLTGTYNFVDADNDPEDAAGMEYLWQVSHPTTGAPVSVGTNRTYVVRAEDQGASRRIWFTVMKAKSLTGSPIEQARPTSPEGQWQKSRLGAIDGNAPTMTTPTITGTTTTGQVLTGTPNGYADLDGDVAGTHAYKWYRADNAAGTLNKTVIAGATSSTYTIGAGLEGKYLVFEVTPVSATGSPSTGTPMSAVTAGVVTGSAPTMTQPTIAGTAVTGQTLTGVPQGFADPDGDLPGAHTFKWYLASNPAGTGKSEAFGQTSATYALNPSHQGLYVFFEVRPVSATGTPSVGQPVISAPGILVLGREPTMATPSISGTVAVGSTLTGNAFGYSDPDSDPAGTHVYKWYTASNAAGTQDRILIPFATSTTLAVTLGFRGLYIVFEVTPVSAQGNPNTGQPVSRVTAVPVP